jgi:hypothetical protein
MEVCYEVQIYNLTETERDKTTPSASDSGYASNKPIGNCILYCVITIGKSLGLSSAPCYL